MHRYKPAGTDLWLRVAHILAMMLASAPPFATALAPLLLPENLQLTPEQFAVLCTANPNTMLELAASGRLIHMFPTGRDTGFRTVAW